MAQKQQDDSACIEEWRSIIGVFNLLVKPNPAPETIEKDLIELKEQAKSSPNLTYRQVDAITARCDNYLNGTYGNTKRPEHYEQGKPEKAK